MGLNRHFLYPTFNLKHLKSKILYERNRIVSYHPFQKLINRTSNEQIYEASWKLEYRSYIWQTCSYYLTFGIHLWLIGWIVFLVWPWYRRNCMNIYFWLPQKQILNNIEKWCWKCNNLPLLLVWTKKVF